MHRTLVSITIAVVAVAAVAAAALAAPTAPTAPPKGPTGVWTGKTHQDIQPLSDDGDVVEWKQRITIRTWQGRLSYVGVNVRYTCPSPDNPMAGDISIDLGWSIKKNDGPKLRPNGGFSLNVTHVHGKKLYVPVHITGVLREHGASGSFSVGNNTCNGKGTWQAKRTF
jgi:hypothetical protein